MSHTAEVSRRLGATPVTVGTSAVALSSSPLANRQVVTIVNNGSVPVYIGGANVTTTSGFPLMVGESLTFDAGPDVVLYAVSDSAAQDVRVLELG